MLGNYKQGELAIAGKFTRLNGQIQASELRLSMKQARNWG